MIISDPSHIAVGTEDQSRYAYDFSDFINIPTKTDYTFIGIGSGTKIYNLYDKMVLFWTELPNCLLHSQNNGSDYKKTFELQDKFIKILTNCPFSVEYFNKLYNYDKFQYVMVPFNPKYTPLHKEKIYDVYYTGTHFPNIMFPVVPIMQKFKLCIVSCIHGTHPNVSYVEKLKLNAQSKISIVHSLLSWPDSDREWTFNEYKNHKAFELVKSHGIVPQIKTRVFEAAASKSVILSLKDPWNMIESFFSKDEFVYWTDESDLEEKIKYILSHYNEFEPMVTKAYNRLITNYTTKQFFENYLKVL